MPTIEFDNVSFAYPGGRRAAHNGLAFKVVAGVMKRDFFHGGDVMYTGRFSDPITSLQWNRDRWYNPGGLQYQTETGLVGRFISEDPIFPEWGTNPYEYCNNSPTNERDPSGMMAYAYLGDNPGISRAICFPSLLSRRPVPAQSRRPTRTTPSAVPFTSRLPQLRGNQAPARG